MCIDCEAQSKENNTMRVLVVIKLQTEKLPISNRDKCLCKSWSLDLLRRERGIQMDANLENRIGQHFTLVFFSFRRIRGLAWLTTEKQHSQIFRYALECSILAVILLERNVTLDQIWPSLKIQNLHILIACKLTVDKQ